jgi:hypothetical protein
LNNSILERNHQRNTNAGKSSKGGFKMRKASISFLVLAAFLAAAPLAKAGSDSFNFVFTDGNVSGSGILYGSYVSSGAWLLTSGTGTFNDGSTSGTISLVTNPNGPGNISLSPLGYFGYDDLLYIWSGPNQILDEAGLLFSFNSIELNLWQGGNGPGAGGWTENFGEGDQNGTFAVTSYNIQQTPLTISGTAVIVTPGATTANTSSITVTPATGFTGSVTLSAAVTSSPAGAQYPPTLSFGSTSPVSINGTTAETATLTITTTAATKAALVQPKHPGLPWYAAGGATLACLLLFGIPARRRKWRTLLGMLALLAALMSGVFACGGGGSAGGGSGGGGGGGGTSIPGTTAGTYTITVTGTSGTGASAITAASYVTLTVQNPH